MIQYGNYFYSDEEREEAEKLDEFIENCEADIYDLHSYDDMVDIVVHNLKGDQRWCSDINLAAHILDALRNRVAEYYRYDITSGTLETPVPIDSVEELIGAYPEIFKEACIIEDVLA